MESKGVVRGRRGSAEAARDREWLRWIGRFRFVTTPLLAARFAVSEQQANGRVRRLAAAGLVSRTSGGIGQAYAIALTRRGARSVGLPERREPRTDSQRHHELAIVDLVGRLERRLEGESACRVLTERECRERQGVELGRYSVAVFRRARPARSSGGRTSWLGVPSARWPTRSSSRRSAERFRAILDAYASSAYVDVCFLVTSPAVARAVARWNARNGGASRVRVLPWVGAREDVRQAVAAAIAQSGDSTPREWRS
jgi:hypothetical protein